jgi:hypothetical protein
VKTILSWRRYHYLARVIVFLITVALIAGIGGCVYTPPPPPSENLEIRTWYDLDAVRKNLAGNHTLMNDLDSTTPGYQELASPTANQGKGWKPIGWGYWASARTGIQVIGEIFKGTLDGQGYEIRDLYINSQEQQVGLFGFVAEGAIIKDITLINATVTDGEAAGGPVGLNEDNVRCFDVASVVAVGGLVGYNGGTMSNCYVMGNVNGDSGVGGLVGDNEGTVSNCYATGSVRGNEGVGGLVGDNEGTVSNSCSTGSVSGDEYVGGLVGYNGGTVSNSYYNYDKALINGKNVITIGALFGEDFEEWLDNGKFLDVNERLSQENGYYLINYVSDFKQLLVFGQNDTLKFRLTNDLDLGDESNFYIPYFAGEFDGNGHKISNLSFNSDFVYNVGLFGYLAPGGKVSGLGVENINVTGYSDVGGLVGINLGTVSNCYATGSVTGDGSVGGLVGHSNGTVSDSCSSGSVTGEGDVGGLVGANYFGTVSNSYSTGTTTGTWGTGGVVGYNWKGTVINSYSTGSVTGASWVGGLVGYNWGGTVNNSYSTGTITGGTITGTWGTGGVVGGNTGTVSNSYSTGGVSCDELVGGLVGLNAGEGSVSNSYSTGSVTGTSRVGGLVGSNDGTVSNSFWDTETSGQSTSDGGTGKTTVQMKDIATFSGVRWKIIAVALNQTNPSYIWNIVDKQTYPFLSWQPVV